MSYPQETFLNTTLHDDSTLERRRRVVSRNTILYQLQVLKQTGRYDAFKLKWHPSYDDTPDVWPIPNHLFWDSDVAKWIEGACYLLHSCPDSSIDAAIRELVGMISSAQQEDGYLNIHYQVVEPGKRFTNLRDMHELYNAGHLIEAALAHQTLYKNDDLLSPILKYVTLLCNTFGPGKSQIHGYPGHPEVELALLRLYQRTGDSKILSLAEYFIRERGNAKGCNGEHYYAVEAQSRQEDLEKRPVYWPTLDCLWYYQAHEPIEQQQSIEGHSVRAMYLLTAVADLVGLEGASKTPELYKAVQRLWRNMVDKKMYVTGGIGAMRQWEGFGIDYYLPQSVEEGGCYSETCAAIGVMMLAERMLQIDLNGEYGDIMELCLYNSVLTAMSHDGKAFTYVNQLASSDGDLSKRESWFTCSCCPPNVMRLLGQIGGYATSYKATNNDSAVSINVHLYLSSTVHIPVGDREIKFSQHTDWPWSGNVRFEFCQLPKVVNLSLRIPSWADFHHIEPSCPGAVLKDGYLSIPPEWLSDNRTFTISMPLRIRTISPHPFTNQDTIIVARGPIIYCVEDVDNPWVQDHFKSLFLDPHGVLEEKTVRDDLTKDEYVQITARNAARLLPVEKLVPGPFQSPATMGSLLSSGTLVQELNFIPYYFRANREGRGHMRVGIRRLDSTLCC